MPLDCWPAHVGSAQLDGGSTSTHVSEQGGSTAAAAAAGAAAAAAAAAVAAAGAPPSPPLHAQSDAGQLGGWAPQLCSHQAASTLVRVRVRVRVWVWVWVWG